MFHPIKHQLFLIPEHLKFSLICQYKRNNFLIFLNHNTFCDITVGHYYYNKPSSLNTVASPSACAHKSCINLLIGLFSISTVAG